MIDLRSRTPSPPACAFGAEPLSADEIDAHPDSARIWATIMSLREDFWSAVEDEARIQARIAAEA